MIVFLCLKYRQLASIIGPLIDSLRLSLSPSLLSSYCM